MVASEQAVVTGKQLDTMCINTIRTLAIDAVQQANSGHPGAPMGLAPVTYCLWQEFLRYDPEDPKWLNRDRFVLSNGHSSMLLYAMLHLAGVREVAENGEVLKELAVFCYFTHSRKVKHRVKQHGRMAVRQHEPVAVQPLRILRVVA